MSTRRPQFSQQVLIDTTPLPSDIPAVKEVGASSAPLLSASFFIGARCRDYNDDYMQCKNENPGRGEFECLKEGRRVTRCATSPTNSTPVHLRPVQTFADVRIGPGDGKPFVPAQEDA
ncbi:unnamed protein product [Fusarium graminearum]|nr:unnamed protein product [Fusarium graminearum]